VPSYLDLVENLSENIMRDGMVSRAKKEEDVALAEERMRGMSWPVYDARCPVMSPASAGWEEVAVEDDQAFGII